MKVRIMSKAGEELTFDSSEVIVMLKLSDSEKIMLREMPADCTIFASFPDVMGSENQKLGDISAKMEDFKNERYI